MSLPVVINPGDPGHITNHEEIHGLLDDVDQAGGYLLSQFNTDTLANRPAAGTAGRLFYPTDAQVLFFDTGAAWAPISTRSRVQDIESTAPLTLTTAFQDVTGATLSLTNYLTSGECRYMVVMSFDIEVSVSGVGVCIGEMQLDGISTGHTAIHQPATTGRETVTQTVVGTLVTAASHTWKLRAAKNTGAGTASIPAGGAHFSILLVEGLVA